MFGLAGPHALPGHTEGVQTHVGRRLVRLARRRPVRLGLRRLDHAALLLLRSQPLAGAFGAAGHRRGRHAHAREALEHVLGRVGERGQGAGQTHQR